MNTEGGYNYSDTFFDYIERGSRRSAARVVATVAAALKPRSLLDIGCGRGVWVEEWMRAGVSDGVGVDGSYVHAEQLRIPGECFTPQDLSKPFDLGRAFDLVQSLEVAEHVDSKFADVFVDNLCRHGQVILFSAAVPGQGGEMHINEQPLDYWKEKFQARGYLAFDWLRPIISRMSDVEPWYRYNSILYVSMSAAERLPAEVQATKLLPTERIASLAPFPWRLRNGVLKLLPPSALHKLAKIKHKAELLTRGRR